MLLKLNKSESGGGNKPALGETEKTETEELKKSGADIKGARKTESGAAAETTMENRAKDPERKHLEERAL